MALREELEKLRADRKRVQKDLKNAQRRKRRLKGKARQLTNTDLLEVLLMRQADKAEPASQEVAERERRCDGGEGAAEWPGRLRGVSCATVNAESFAAVFVARPVLAKPGRLRA